MLDKMGTQIEDSVTGTHRFLLCVDLDPLRSLFSRDRRQDVVGLNRAVVIYHKIPERGARLALPTLDGRHGFVAIVALSEHLNVFAHNQVLHVWRNGVELFQSSHIAVLSSRF